MSRISRTLRIASRRLHRLLGLWLGGVFALAGMTGSLLAFYPEVDAWLQPRVSPAVASQPVHWERVLQTLRREFPDLAGGWRFEITPQPGPIPARYYDPPQSRGRDFAPLMVWVDSDRQRVVRRDIWGDYAMTWIYDLHYRLLLDKPGALVMGIAGILLCVLLSAGVTAWWPRRGTWWRSTRFKRRAGRVRRLHDLHKLAGLVGLPVLLIITLSGVMLEFPEQSRSLLALASPPHTMPDPRSIVGEQRITVDRALSIACAHFPRATAAWIETPKDARGVYRMRLMQPGEPSRRFPHSFVWIDQYSGAVLADYDARHTTANDTVMNWLHALHSGQAFGLTGRSIVLLAGLLPVFLLCTGLMRQRARKTAHPRHDVSAYPASKAGAS
jgi:uncharacterized iron-regulated membrane protein